MNSTRRRWLGTVLHALDSPDSPKDSAGGLAPLLMLLLLPLLPLSFGGIVRATAGVSFTVGVLVGVVVTGLTVAAIVAAHPRRVHDRRLALQTVVVLAVLVAGTFGVLWGRALDGLGTSGGWDAGNHLNLRRMFIEQDAAAYDKFVTFYAVTHGLEIVLGLNAFESFRAGFYAIPVALIICLLAAHAGVAHGGGEGDRASARVGQLALGLLAVGAGLVAVLPLLHYHQADGFYAHLFGLVPLVAGLTHYALVRRRAVRLVALLGWVALQRFTYGLNLGDAATTAAILLAVEAAQLRHSRRLRVALFALAAIVLAGALYIYAALSVLLPITGGFLQPGLRYLLAGELLLSGLLLGLPSVARRAGVALGAVAERLARYAAAFGMVNVGVQVLLTGLGAPREYYFLKYNLYGVVLVLTAALVLAAALIGRALTGGEPSSRRVRPLAAAVLAVVGCAFVAFGLAYRPYYGSFRERVHGTPPWRAVFPLAERLGWRRIQATLAAEGCVFGGFLAPSVGNARSLGQSHFTNAAFGLLGSWKDAPHRLIEAVIVQKPGYCLFWYGGERHRADYDLFQQHWGGRMADTARTLDGLTGKRCEEYPAAWDRSAPLRLCHVSGLSISATLDGPPRVLW
jgi:hypothetical protein